MSEIKPSFWLAKVDHVSLTHEEGADALHLCATVSRGDCRLQETDVPLYTAEHLAEAVAAERERCAKLVKEEITAFVGDRRQFIRKAEAREILKSIRQSIRSTQK